MNFNNPKVGSPQIIEKMNTRGVLNDGTTINYALGQTTGTYRGLAMIGHGGADAGFRTFLARFPEHEAAVIVFSNDAGFSSNTIAMRVADIVLEELLDEEKEDEPWDKNVTAADPALFPFFEGHFKLADDNHIIFTTENDTLHFQSSIRREPAPLYPLSDRIFISEEGRVRFEFPEHNHQPVKSVTLTRGDESTELPRTEPFDPSKVALEDFTGYYYSHELDITYSLKVKEDKNGEQKLVSTQLRIGEITLTPLTPNHFAGSMWFVSRIRFERDEKDTVTGFRASGGRARNVWFERVR